MVEAAAALADEEGLEALSLSKLASKLGIRTPSLYNHVAGLEGLRRELALLGLRELGSRIGRAAMGRTTEEGTFAIARAYRDFVKERPGLYAATVRSSRLSYPDDPDFEAAEREAFEAVLAVLASYGLHGEDALHAARGLRSVVHGCTCMADIPIRRRDTIPPVRPPSEEVAEWREKRWRGFWSGPTS